MAENKTQPTDVDVDAFLADVPEPRRTQARHVRDLMTRITGTPARMWGPSMIGFGTMRYQGKAPSGDWFVVGLAARKAALTVYGVYNDYGPPDPLFDELGPHTTGKGCLYLKSLDDIDEGVLEHLIANAWKRAAVS